MKSCGCASHETGRINGRIARGINYTNICCVKCGLDITDRFIKPNGQIIEYMSLYRFKHLMCVRCQKLTSSENGIKISHQYDKVELTQIQRDLIIGSILGDGTLERSPGLDHSNWGLSVKHGLKQSDYCKWKASILDKLITLIDYPTERIRFRTIKCKAISELAISFTKDGKKSIKYESLLDIGPMAFAIWYLDDGNLLPYRISKTGLKRKPEIRFATHSFTEEENVALSTVLTEKIGVKPTKCSWTCKRNFGSEDLLKIPKKFYGIRLYGDNAVKFIEYIKPYVDITKSGMGYKFNMTLRGPLDNKHTRSREQNRSIQS